MAWADAVSGVFRMNMEDRMFGKCGALTPTQEADMQTFYDHVTPKPRLGSINFDGTINTTFGPRSQGDILIRLEDVALAEHFGWRVIGMTVNDLVKVRK
jgi:hypothetical protein